MAMAGATVAVAVAVAGAAVISEGHCGEGSEDDEGLHDGCVLVVG